MLFLFDRNLPEKLARMLGQYDRQHDVSWLDDKFPQSTPDVDWLTGAAAWPSPPVIVSGDGRILTNEAEAQVLGGLPLTFFHFVPAWLHLPWEEMAWKSVRVWPEIVRNAQPLRPTVFEVPVSGLKVDRYCLTEELTRAKRKKR